MKFLRQLMSPSLIVSPDQTARWETIRHANYEEHYGFFVTRDSNGRVQCSLAGRIVERSNGSVSVFVRDPPERLRQHRHGPCLQLVSPNDRWFRLHWEKPPKGAEASRVYVEAMLAEAFDC